jgi:MerR family transcriptional regulator, light-induced transcriptional regulator
MAEAALLRIGELSRRSGVSPELLRAWERRYRLLQPHRSEGGLRLYSAGDLERVRNMQRHLAEGIAAAEAARLATQEAESGPEPAMSAESARTRLAAAFAAFDENGGHAVLDSVLAGMTLDAVISDVVVPYLHELGERWQRGEASVEEEHFASGVLRGRLLGLARGWGQGLGPRVLLACAPGEQHDLGLIAFGLALRARGWRVGFLGPDTPVVSVANAADAFEPSFVVVSSVGAERLNAHAAELEELARARRLCVGGAGASTATLHDDVLRLGGGPVEEAEQLTALASEPR